VWLPLKFVASRESPSDPRSDPRKIRLPKLALKPEKPAPFCAWPPGPVVRGNSCCGVHHVVHHDEQLRGNNKIGYSPLLASWPSGTEIANFANGNELTTMARVPMRVSSILPSPCAKNLFNVFVRGKRILRAES
jgi:hypothetical protein